MSFMFWVFLFSSYWSAAEGTPILGIRRWMALGGFPLFSRGFHVDHRNKTVSSPA